MRRATFIDARMISVGVGVGPSCVTYQPSTSLCGILTVNVVPSGRRRSQRDCRILRGGDFEHAAALIGDAGELHLADVDCEGARLGGIL